MAMGDPAPAKASSGISSAAEMMSPYSAVDCEQHTRPALVGLTKLSERSFLGGRTRLPKLMTDFTERRLVRRISMSLCEDSDSSNHEIEIAEAIGADAPGNSSPTATVRRRPVPALLHRKELVVGNMLGQGSFSQVMEVRKFSWKKEQELYLSPKERSARQRLEQQGSSYAVKHLNRTLLRRPKQFYQAALELAREAEFMTQLNHPNLLKARAVAYGGTAALESGRYNDFFIVSDRLVDTLDERIRKWQRSFSPALVIKLQYALQLGSALEYLHAKRFIFRDIKTANCGFRADGTLQLFDFGFCRRLLDGPSSSPTLGDTTATETYRMSMAGTARYMAPEMMLGQPYGCKVDVYSWSLVLYELLAEDRVYADLRRHHQFIRYVAELESRPETIALKLPTPLEELLQNAWHPRVEQRYTMTQCLEALEPVYKELEKQHKCHHKTNNKLMRASTTGPGGTIRSSSSSTGSPSIATTASADSSSSKSLLQSQFGRTQSLPSLHGRMSPGRSRDRSCGGIVDC